jgi:hypothetical protein
MNTDKSGGVLEEKGDTYNSVEKYWKALNTAHVKKTAKHTEENNGFFQRRFGIKAGFCRFSWRCIQ